MVIIFTTWSTGYAARYCVDFAWQIVIGAFAQTYNWINPTWVYTDQAAAEAMSFERLFEFWR